uniref:Transposase Tc1-like domain-containing protein n=1 Tax=Cyprinus carpio carpio TaxID=630221 RepID=A0A9J8A173_CYPCA
MPRSGRPSKFTPRADRKMLKEITKNPKISSQDLQQAFATVDVKVHASTVRKRLQKFNFHERCARRKPLLSKKNIKARLKFARENVDKDQDFWNNVLWTVKEPHTNCKTWRWKSPGLGVFCCSRTWLAHR